MQIAIPGGGGEGQKVRNTGLVYFWYICNGCCNYPLSENTREQTRVRRDFREHISKKAHTQMRLRSITTGYRVTVSAQAGRW